MRKLVVLSLLIGLAACCQKGDQGVIGPVGIPGQEGPVGRQGDAGVPGTAITVIQFCPGVVPTYPTTFPEVGFCIEGQIYAVYSKNDGFLTLIPPGNYNSNAVGSSCNFTVDLNCVVGGI